MHNECKVPPRLQSNAQVLKHPASSMLFLRTALALTFTAFLSLLMCRLPAADLYFANLQLSRSLYWIAFSNTIGDTGIRVTRSFYNLCPLRAYSGWERSKGYSGQRTTPLLSAHVQAGNILQTRCSDYVFTTSTSVTMALFGWFLENPKFSAPILHLSTKEHKIWQEKPFLKSQPSTAIFLWEDSF